MSFLSNLLNWLKGTPSPSVTSSSPPPKLTTEEVSLAAFKQNDALIKRLEEITQSPHSFPEVTRFDLHEYPDNKFSTFVLLRDLTLTQDPKDVRNIVGYDFE